MQTLINVASANNLLENINEGAILELLQECNNANLTDDSWTKTIWRACGV